jgi:iron complex outermembrane receptor protein
MKKIVVLLAAVLLLTGGVTAQKQVTGQVIDVQTNEGLIGVNIVVEGTNNGTSTDINSHFEIKHNTDIKKLIVSYTGFQQKTVEVKGSDFLTIYLEPSSIELDQFIVSASRDEQQRKDAPVSMSIVSTKDINELKPTTMPDILRTATGVHIANFGNEQQSMAIRQPLSFSRTQLVILEDGVPIGPTSITSSGDLKDINMAMIRSTEVLRGPTSSLYGSEAIGGAINFLTKRPSLLPTSSAMFQMSDCGYSRADVFVSDKIGKLDLLFGGYYAEQKNGFFEYSDFNKVSFTVKGVYRIGVNDIITAKVNYTDFYTDWKGSIDSNTFYTNPQLNMHTFTYGSNENLRASVKYDRIWSEKSKTFVTAFYRNDRTEEIPSYLIRAVWGGPPPPKYKGEFIESAYQSYGMIAQHKLKFDLLNTELIIGASVDYTPDEYKSHLLNVQKGEENKYVSYSFANQYVQNFDAKLLNSAAYVHLVINPIEKLKVLAALRYDNLSYEYDNHLPPSASSGAPDETNSFQNISPKIGATYNFTNNIGSYANYSVGFAPPLFSQLYKNVVVPELEPSVYYNYEAGAWAGFFKGKLYTDLSVYLSNGENEIVQVLMPDFSTRNESAGKTKHYGVEYTVKYSPIDDISFRFSGTNVMHEFVEFIDNGVDYSGNEMDIAPNFIANSMMTFYPRFLKGFRIGIEWQHIGPYYMDQANSEEFEGYDMFNLRAGYQYKGFDVWMNIVNMADELIAARVSKTTYGTNVVKSYSVGCPRMIYLGVGYNFVGKSN